MALIQCPECGSRISEKALACPYCGFVASNETGIVPISSLPPVPQKVAISIPDASIFDNGTSLVARSTRVRLAEVMEDADRMAELAPAIYDAICKLLEKRGTIWAADFSEAAQKLMDSGELVLSVEKKTGKLLPQLRSVKTGRVYEKARLHAEKLPSDLGPALSTLQTQILLADLMGEVKNLTATVEALRLEGRGERIGRAKGVWLDLQQAAAMQDPRLREQRLLAIASKATEQRSILQESFKVQLKLASSKQAKNATKGQAAKDAIVYLTTIALMTRSECAAAELVGEREAAQTAIKQLAAFVDDNHLDNPNTLRDLNSKSNENLESAAKQFQQIASKVNQLSLEAGANWSAPALPEESSEQ